MSSPPSTLGQYQIIREIARSNDIVYEAYDPLMNRRVAIKELMMPTGSTPQQREDRISRFKREAQAAGTLNHTNIMTVYSFAEDAGHTFMAMEFLDGQTLRNELDARGALSPDRAIEIAIAVLSGLEHAHSKGVIHRDIKPDNIQILSNGQIKITDFGIARLTFQPNLTVDGQVFGTPSYMSPEQVVGREIDARSDIFSVGVMLYEMLTGQKPFSGDSVVSTTYAIMNKDPDQPSSIPWPLWSVISRALEKSPSMRWSSANDMMEALEEASDPNRAAMPLVDPNLPPGYLPSANPYATPQAPPIASMYGGPGGVYDPYTGAQANPYGSQYSQQQPVAYPYNPYQGPGGAYAPHTPGMPPPGTAPVYYPPPPRRPLIKPEQVDVLKKIILAIVFLGLLFWLIVAGVQFLLFEISQITTQQKQVLDQQKAIQAKDEARRDQQDNRYPEAEVTLDRAIDTDPNDATLREERGRLLFTRAMSLEAPEALQLYEQSADDYNEAASNQADQQKRDEDSLLFAQASFNFAANALNSKEMVREKTLQKARIDLERSAPLVQTLDPGLYQNIMSLLPRLR
jgi:serine/threonine-protein kinase